jgi:hypothetical protein
VQTPSFSLFVSQTSNSGATPDARRAAATAIRAGKILLYTALTGKGAHDLGEDGMNISRELTVLAMPTLYQDAAAPDREAAGLRSVAPVGARSLSHARCVWLLRRRTWAKPSPAA